MILKVIFWFRWPRHIAMRSGVPSWPQICALPRKQFEQLPFYDMHSNVSRCRSSNKNCSLPQNSLAPLPQKIVAVYVPVSRYTL